jgi:hypothetical protein
LPVEENITLIIKGIYLRDIDGNLGCEIVQVDTLKNGSTVIGDLDLP